MSKFDNKQQLALLHLLFTNPQGGNEPQLQNSGLTKKEWKPFVEAQLVEFIAKPPNRAIFVRATDEAWSWATSNLSGAAPAPPKRPIKANRQAPTVKAKGKLGIGVMQTRLLTELLTRLQPYLEHQGESIAGLFATSAHASSTDSVDVAPRVVFEAIKKLGDVGERIRLKDIRSRLATIGKGTLDAELLKLQRERQIVIYPLDNPSEITPADRDAALLIAGAPHHIVYREN